MTRVRKDESDKNNTFVARSWGVVLWFGRRSWGPRGLSTESRVWSAILVSSARPPVVFALSSLFGGHRSSAVPRVCRKRASLPVPRLGPAQSFPEVGGHRWTLPEDSVTGIRLRASIRETANSIVKPTFFPLSFSLSLDPKIKEVKLTARGNREPRERSNFRLRFPSGFFWPDLHDAQNILFTAESDRFGSNPASWSRIRDVSPNIRTYKNGKVETRNGETNEKVTRRRKKKETEATIRSEEKGIAVRDRYTREGSVSAA